MLFSCTVQKNYSVLGLQDLVLLAPTNIFDETTEGISLSEKKVLFTKGDSKNWKTIQSDDKLVVVEAKSPYSRLSLFRLINKKYTPILIVFTQNEKVASINSYSYIDKKFRPVKLLDYVKPADFFKDDDKNKIANKYPNAINYKLSKDGIKFDCTINAWMNKELDDLNKDFHVSLIWNGNRYKKLIIPIEH